MRKNILKISALALLSAFALTSCSDDVIAKPDNYDNNSPVITIEGFNGTIHNNNFTDIYDGVRDGSLAQDVLDNLLYQYSVSIFGNYNKVTAAKIGDENHPNPYGEITLKAAVAGLNADATDGNDNTKKFIKEHSAYWTKNKAGNRVDDSNKEVGKDADPSKSEYARLNNKWKTIEKRIAEKLYAAVSGGSYSDRNIFKEEKYLRALAADIENNVRAASANPDLFEGILTSKVEDYEVFTVKTECLDATKGEDFILHRQNYQSNADLNQEESTTQDATYVEDKIIPEIYRQLLVEQYILDESYDTLGRTSARHIDVLAIAKNSEYAKGAVNLMNTFVKDTIFNNARTEKITLDDFKLVSNAWVGAFMADKANHPKEYQLMQKAIPEYETSNSKGEFFQGTAYGSMMEELEKIDNNPALSENESTYTNSGAYTWETGRDIKIAELQLKDYTSTGWYVKSVGVASLPDSIKNQLFDINVANALNGDKCVEYTYDATASKWGTNEAAGDTNLINVIGKVKDQYFLRNTSRIAGNPVESDILFESDGTYYIVLVQDAIRSKNLNKANYAEATAAELDKLETYINEIVQLVADNDTYQNLSKKHWIKKMNIKFHDTVVYNYFKSTFPEIFED